MNTNIPTSAVLDAAADAIQMAGWTKGGGWVGHEEFGGENHGRLCLEGGIMAAAGIDMRVTGRDWLADLTDCPAYQAVKSYLDTRSPLFTWNDRPERTAEEVIEVLRAAAAVERVKEATPVFDTEDQPLPVEIPVAA